jgi:hypothetical protein
LVHDAARVAKVANTQVLVDEMLDVSWLNPSVELGEEAVLVAGVERPARRTKTRVRAARHDTERLRMGGGGG